MAYKVIEVSPVDEARIEDELNRWLKEGYRLERLEFIQKEGVRRPIMVFLFLWTDAKASGATLEE